MKRNNRRDFSRRMLNSNRRRAKLNSALSENVRTALEETGNYEDWEIDEIIKAANALGYQDNEVADHEWIVIPASDSVADFAEEWLNYTYAFEELPEDLDWMIDYLDYKAYGNMLLSYMYVNNNGNGNWVVDATNSSI